MSDQEVPLQVIVYALMKSSIILIVVVVFSFYSGIVSADIATADMLDDYKATSASTVWVDFKFLGDEHGTFEQPYNTLAEGIGAVDVGGILIIKTGSTNETPLISKAMTIRSYGGMVIIGKGSSPGFPQLRGKMGCAWGSSDCNPCVNNVIESFNRLRSHGDILGFQLGGHDDPTLGRHWQGVQRIMSGGGRYMAVSRNEIQYGGSSYSGFVIVKMDSRDGGGRRFRSNRLQVDRDFSESAPPENDLIIHTELINSALNHAGGLQVMGNLLAVPIEGGYLPSEVHFYNLSNPEYPLPVGSVLYRYDQKSGTAALAQLIDGRYLLVVGGNDAEPLDFYVSTEASSLEFMHIYRTTGQWEGINEAYQSLNLVTECTTGDLYLVGMHNNGIFGIPGGEDWADLFSVRNGPGNSVDIQKVANLHAYCEYRGTNHCNFDAAGGVYVDPAGQLFLYSTEHDNDGPPCLDCSDGSIKFMEFRPVPHSSCDTINQAWVELYDDSQFQDRSLMIDYVDRALEDYSDYHKIDDFNDKASSACWCIPQGWAYNLYQDTGYGGRADVLQGTGSFQQIPDLSVDDFGDRASSSKWVSTKDKYSPSLSLK